MTEEEHRELRRAIAAKGQRIVDERSQLLDTIQQEKEEAGRRNITAAAKRRAERLAFWASQPQSQRTHMTLGERAHQRKLERLAAQRAAQSVTDEERSEESESAE